MGAGLVAAPDAVSLHVFVALENGEVSTLFLPGFQIWRPAHMLGGIRLFFPRGAEPCSREVQPVIGQSIQQV